MPILIDTHCHLNDPGFEKSVLEVIERARASGVESFVVPAYDMGSLERTMELASSFPGVVYPAYGVHPWFVDHGADYEKVLSFLRRGSPVAVGEVGLDFSPQCPPQGIQVEALTRQISFAHDLDLPLTIYSDENPVQARDDVQAADPDMSGTYVRGRSRKPLPSLPTVPAIVGLTAANYVILELLKAGNDE